MNENRENVAMDQEKKRKFKVEISLQVYDKVFAPKKVEFGKTIDLNSNVSKQIEDILGYANKQMRLRLLQTVNDWQHFDSVGFKNYLNSDNNDG